jgi:hypothetical protein
MTWDAKDLRKNVDPVPQELLDEKGVGVKEVGEMTPYNELLEELWAPYMAGMDSPLAASSIPQDVLRSMAEHGMMTPNQLAFKRKLYMRDVEPDSGLHDPSLYETSD